MLSQLIGLVLILTTYGSLDDHHEDSWVEPNVWNRNADKWKLMNDNDASSCPVCNGAEATTPEEGAALIYYKKFIRNMFNRDKMMYKENDGLYQHSILFTILPEQMDKLEQLEDPRDLDMVLTEIIANARKINVFGEHVHSKDGIIALVMDIISDLLLLLKKAEIRFFLFVASSALFGWFLHHRYHIGIVTLVVSGFLLFGYFMTYLECNQKLKIKELLEFVSEEENTEPSWYSSMYNLFISKKDERIDHLKKSSEINLPFCRPDHVLMMYVNDMFLKQLEFLVENFNKALSSYSNTMPFPFSLLAPLLMLFLITYLLKLTFKYILSPKAWATLLHRNPHSQNPPMISDNSGASGDRISGENLKILLNAIKTPSVLITSGNTIPPAVSGVQEVLEQIEEAPPSNNNISGKNSISNSPNTSHKKESGSEELDKSKVTLEDSFDY